MCVLLFLDSRRGALVQLSQRYIGIKLPATLADRLLELARREHNNLSAVTRRLLSEALARDDQQQRQQRPEKARPGRR